MSSLPLYPLSLSFLNGCPTFAKATQGKPGHPSYPSNVCPLMLAEQANKLIPSVMGSPCVALAKRGCASSHFFLKSFFLSFLAYEVHL